MQCSQRLLAFGLGRYKPHGGTAGGLANSFSIDEVVLVALDEWAHELRRNELTLMPKFSQPTSHVMGSGTCLHDDGAYRKSCEGFDELCPVELLAKKSLAEPVLTVNVKRVFTEINTNNFSHTK